MSRINELVMQSWTQLGLNQPEVALVTATKALVIDCNNFQVLDVNGQVLSVLGEYDRAIDYFKKSLQLSDDIDINLRLANAYRKKGEKLEAVNVYDAILKKDKNNIKSHYHIAHIYKENKLLEAASIEFKRVIDQGVKTKVKTGWMSLNLDLRKQKLGDRQYEYLYTNGSYQGLIATEFDLGNFGRALKNLISHKAFQVKHHMGTLLYKLKP